MNEKLNKTCKIKPLGLKGTIIAVYEPLNGYKEYTVRYYWNSEQKNVCFLEQEIEIINKNLESKEWLHEKCGTNTPPKSIPEKILEVAE